MKYSALIPVKTLELAKSRLAPYFSRQQRSTLVLHMLQHVIQTLHASEAFEQIYVVSADSRVLQLAKRWSAFPLRETRSGHNPALQAAAQTLLIRSHAFCMAIHACAAQRATTLDVPPACLTLDEGLLTISADLPLLGVEDVFALLQAAEEHQVVLASSSDGTGTNALLTRPPLALPYLFGTNSLSAYIQAAQDRHLNFMLLHNPRLALDIDTRDDIDELAHFNSWLKTLRFAV